MTVNVSEQLAGIRQRLGERRLAAANAGQKVFGSTAPSSSGHALSDAVKEDLRHILNRVQMSVRLNNHDENSAPNSGLPLSVQRVPEIT